MDRRTPLDQVRSAPLGAITFAGFGPAARRTGPLDLRRLRKFLDSADNVHVALDSCGTTGVRLVTVILTCGGRLDAAEVAYQTAHANPAEIAAALDRLAAAGIVVRDDDGSVAVTATVTRLVRPRHRSLADAHAVTSDELGAMCRALGIATPARRADRLDSVRAVFADPAERDRVRAALSAAALALLGDIVEVAGHTVADAGELDLPYWELRHARLGAYRPAGQHPGEARGEALRELVQCGIAGVDVHDATVWVWAEAWPFVERPIVVDWSSVPRPPLEAHSQHGEPAVPTCVGVLDRLLVRWAEQPPAVLKNGDSRLGKNDARTLAKAISAEPATVEVLARSVIGLRMALANEVRRSGRGRAQQVDHAWCLDADLQRAWSALPARQRWVRLLAEWCAPGADAEPEVLANRHLVLWELLQLEPSEAYVDDDRFAAWFEDQHAPIAQATLARDALNDLRALGAVGAGAVALTALGRAALTDPTAAAHDDHGAAATRAFVQADLTVIAPPDLRHDLVLALDRLAVTESTGGATIYRLDAGRITRAVQAGDTAGAIVSMLTELAAAPLPDTVSRLVHDAAAGAASVQLAPAASVLVVDDPAQLTAICAIKALKLTRLAPNVAVTDVALAKVQATLVTKGIAPKLAGAAPAAAGRSNAALAEEAEREAAELRARNRGRGANPFVERYATQLEERAAELRDLDGHFAVPAAPLTLTPQTLARLGGEDRDDG